MSARRTTATRRSLADQVRDLINDRGLTGYALAKSTGINRSVVNRFLAGGGLTLETLDAIAAALGLRLVESGRRISGARRRSTPEAEP